MPAARARDHDSPRARRRNEPQNSRSTGALQPSERRLRVSRFSRAALRPVSIATMHDDATKKIGDDRIRAAGDKAFVLYEGKRTPHRSCGICVAETFGLPTRAYQALRRGGITGEGECGAIKAGELVLGELLGDPDPTAPVTDALRRAAVRYREIWRAALAGHVGDSIVCNDLVARFPLFQSAERMSSCTRIASETAAAVARVLAEAGVEFEIPPLDLEDPRS